MGSGRLGLSAIDKREIWSRWKAGQTLHEIGRACGECHTTRFARCCCLAAAFLLWLVAARGWRSPSLSERAFQLHCDVSGTAFPFPHAG